MANEVYMVHGILLPDATLLSQLTDTSPQSGSDLMTGYASGHAYPLFRAIREQLPEFPFTSEAIGTILGKIVAGGNNYALDLSAGNTDLQCRQAQDLGIRYAPAVASHERLRMSRAVLGWESVTGQYRGDATIACRLVGTYDGVNPAVQQVGTGTLTGTPASAEHFTLGPVKINGAWLPVPQTVTVNSGLDWLRAGGGNDPAPRFTGVRITDDILSITALGKPWANYGLAGGVVGALSIYFCRKFPDGHNYADAALQHVKITATNGMILPDSAQGGGNDPMENTLRIACRAATGAASVLTISTGVAII